MTARTQDLICAGDPVHYHGSRVTEGRFPGGTLPVRAGERYDQILAFAYPDNNLSRLGSATLNLPVITQSESPAGEKMPQWRRVLQDEMGYNEPDVFAVCRLVSGFPIPIGSRNGCLFVTSLRFRIGLI